MDTITLIFLCLGIIMGIIIKDILDNRKRVIGVVQIDHETGLCRFKVTRETLANPKVKEVIFVVDHDAKITDDMLEN